MKYPTQFICLLVAIVGMSCTERTPKVIRDMNSANSREDQERIFNRIATNSQERTELFSYINTRPNAVAEAKAKMLAMHKDQTNKLSLQPSLLEFRGSSSPQYKCKGMDYTFASPWPDIDEWKSQEGQWIAFQDKDNHTIMLSKSYSTNTFEDFVLSELTSTTNDMTWINAFAFPGNTNNQGVNFYRQCLNVTPKDLRESETIEDVFRYHARMAIKLMLLSGNDSPVVYEIAANGLEGFQFQNSEKPSRFQLLLFDDSGEKLDLAFGFTKEVESPITQDDVNCVIQSLKRN